MAKRMVIFVFTAFTIWTAIETALGIKHKKTRAPSFEAMQKISIFHTQNWQNTYNKPLKYVAGGVLDAGTFYLFSSTKPRVIPDNNLAFTPYISKDDVQKEGYILLQACPTNELCIKMQDSMKVEDVRKIYKYYLFVIYNNPNVI